MVRARRILRRSNLLLDELLSNLFERSLAELVGVFEARATGDVATLAAAATGRVLQEMAREVAAEAVAERAAAAAAAAAAAGPVATAVVEGIDEDEIEEEVVAEVEEAAGAEEPVEPEGVPELFFGSWEDAEAAEARQQQQQQQQVQGPSPMLSIEMTLDAAASRLSFDPPLRTLPAAIAATLTATAPLPGITPLSHSLIDYWTKEYDLGQPASHRSPRSPRSPASSAAASRRASPAPGSPGSARSLRGVCSPASTARSSQHRAVTFGPLDLASTSFAAVTSTGAAGGAPSAEPTDPDGEAGGEGEAISHELRARREQASVTIQCAERSKQARPRGWMRCA